MGLRRTSLVLYILFIIFQLQHNFPSVSSRPSSVATNHETLSTNVSKPDVVVFERNYREFAVVIKRRGGGGGGGGSRGGRSGGSSRGGGVVGGGRDGGGGGSRSRSRGGAGVIYPAGSHSRHHSTGSKNRRGAICVVGWLGLSVLAGLFLV